MRTIGMRWLVLLLVCLALPAESKAQSQPFVVHDTKPVITHGPYLVDPSDTSVTVVWITDTPSHALVRYSDGAVLDREAESRRCPLVDHHLEFHRLLDRQAGGNFSSDDTTRGDTDLPVCFGKARPVTHEAASGHELTEVIDRWNSLPCHCRHDPVATAHEQRVRVYQYRIYPR